MTYEILSLNDQGLGVTYVDNKITFVKGACVGDTIELSIEKEYSKYNIARIKKLIKESEKRVKPMCPYFDKCGGCALQIMKYDDTLKYKKEKLENILRKFASINKEVEIVSADHLNYRNKITLHIKNKKIGFYESKTNDVIEIDNCLITSKSINDFIKEISKFNIINGQIIIRSNYNDELLINIISDDKITVSDLSNYKIVGILQNNKVLKGEDKFIDVIGNRYFQVSYDSFFQINRSIATKIFEIIRNNIIKDSNVLDLYCGVGTLGINVSDISNKIYGIEIVENAIINALVNAKMNKSSNTKYLLGDAKSVIDKINDTIDVVIVDPPRKGITKHEIDVIKELNPKQVIYVSCDPITLARDLKLLSDKYEVKKVYALDMFSYTYHCESLAILTQKTEVK